MGFGNASKRKTANTSLRQELLPETSSASLGRYVVRTVGSDGGDKAAEEHPDDVYHVGSFA